jgi:hypothetical protein
MAKQEGMTLLQFQERFSTEEACLEHLFHRNGRMAFAA